MELILKYFLDLSSVQREQFRQLQSLYEYWNRQINVISRKDIENLYQNHVLHSLAIARFCTFRKGHIIGDAGTGGGLPGIPLAIMFPEVSFMLIDATAKKLKVADAVINELGLKNCVVQHERIELVKHRFHFIVSRALTQFPAFVNWTWDKIIPQTSPDDQNGIVYLKGGDLENELQLYKNKVQVVPVSQYFEESFFETKKIIYLPKK